MAAKMQCAQSLRAGYTTGSSPLSPKAVALMDLHVTRRQMRPPKLMGAPSLKLGGCPFLWSAPPCLVCILRALWHPYPSILVLQLRPFILSLGAHCCLPPATMAFSLHALS